jgi:cation transport ATPase
VEGRALVLGNLKLMRDRGIPLDGLDERATQLAGEGKTAMYVAMDGLTGSEPACGVLAPLGQDVRGSRATACHGAD